jgi:hypothetical protein
MQEERAGLHPLFLKATDVCSGRLFELYPAEKYNSTVWHRQAVFSDVMINCSTQWIADGVGLLGQPVYKMVFDAGTHLHGATKPFLFSSGNDTDGC